MMPRKDHKLFEMWSHTKGYKKRIKDAENNIKQILNSKYKPIVEYSGGKDSIVLLHMVMKQDDTIPIYNYHPGYGKYSKQIYRTQAVHKEIMEAARIAGANDLTVADTPFCTKNPDDYLIQDYFPELFKIMEKKGCNLELLGIRGQESITRKHRVVGPLMRKEGGRFVSFPIRCLQWQDIWAYIVEHDLKYPEQYDIYGPIKGYDKVRFTSNFNKNEIYLGGSYYLDGVINPQGRNEIARPGGHWDKSLNEGGDINGRKRC